MSQSKEVGQCYSVHSLQSVNGLANSTSDYQSTELLPKSTLHASITYLFNLCRLTASCEIRSGVAALEARDLHDSWPSSSGLAREETVHFYSANSES